MEMFRTLFNTAQLAVAKQRPKRFWLFAIILYMVFNGSVLGKAIDLVKWNLNSKTDFKL